VSAGRSQHADLLLRLLSNAQGQCHSLRAVDDSEKIAVVVHAYADGPYDRSSFHFAGQPDPVVAVASELAKGAIQGLLVTPPCEEQKDDASRHPFVGIIDHVAVMPLDKNNNDATLLRDENGTYHLGTPTGWVARRIGKVLDQLGVEVHYYGDAHPDGTPLATVRRERTSFFRSGGLGESHPNNSRVGVATVGAPPTFVENYNVRLRSEFRQTARSLTRALRERDGGLPGVEALTLSYGKGRFEVACNLLRPDVGSAEAIEAKVNKWTSETMKAQPSDQLVEKAYRVGTTVDQCLEAISLSDSLESAIEYDDAVMERFKGYILNQD
jgi:glutamate formiminotransferase